MNIFQIDAELRKLQQLRQEQSISILFDVDKSLIADTTKKNLANVINYVKTLDIDDDELMQEIESLLYKIKGRI